nr:p18 [Calliteara abietis nucleopolyhedrovirus]
MATAQDRTIFLYLCDMPAGLQNDKPVDDHPLYFESVVECFEDESVSKYGIFAEQERQKSLFMIKTWCDLINHNHGAYCKHHVLIDALLMYKTYAELVDESAFGNEIFTSCTEFVAHIFKVFRLQSKIIVVLPTTTTNTIIGTINDTNNNNNSGGGDGGGVNLQQDNLSALLKHLLRSSIIEIV